MKYTSRFNRHYGVSCRSCGGDLVQDWENPYYDSIRCASCGSIRPYETGYLLARDPDSSRSVVSLDAARTAVEFFRRANPQTFEELLPVLTRLSLSVWDFLTYMQYRCNRSLLEPRIMAEYNRAFFMVKDFQKRA